MYKIYTLIIGILCLFSISLEARTVQEASAVASAFMQAQNEAKGERLKAKSERIPVELAFTQYQIDNTTPAVYVFNSIDGFVLVSAEDNARAVLGYSDNGTFDTNNIPENMQFWLQMYADELAIKPTPSPSLKGRVARRATAQTQEATYPIISPILGNTIWGQLEPFNNLCPKIGEKRSVAGCVATAIGQVMYAHKYPTTGIGSHSYTTETYQIPLSVDFSKTTYDWEQILPDFTGLYNPIQANAVATLTYHIGVAAEMDYAVEGSGTVSSIAWAGVAEHFGYDKGINILPKDYIKETIILDSIAKDLQAGRPVYIGGVTVKNEGHAFVCDGMQSDGYLHINWGWNGTANGYFALSALAPEVQGTGGSASNLAFTEGVEVYTNIKPNEGGKAQALLTIHKLTRTSADSIQKNQNVSFQLSRLTSSGMADAEGKLKYYIYNSQNEWVTSQEVYSLELETGYLFNEPIEISKRLPSSLAEGEYQLEIRYCDQEGMDYPVLVKGLGEVRVPFTVTNSAFVFGKTPEAPIKWRDLSNVELTLVEGTQTWIVDLFSPNFWGESEQDLLVRCYVHSGSQTSLLGTYIMDSIDDGQVGSVQTDALFYEGCGDLCYSYSPEALHLTMTPAESGKITVQYYIEVKDTILQGEYIAQPEWYSYNNDMETYQFKFDYNYDITSTLSTKKAKQLASELKHTDATVMSYLVQGKIVHFIGEKEEFVLNKAANFYISDDGSHTDELFCSWIKWLNNSGYTTGNELAEGDKVVLLSPLMNYGGMHPTLSKGYVYQHTKATNTENIPHPNKVIIYDIMGRQWKSTDNLPAGVYLINGKKAMITK